MKDIKTADTLCKGKIKSKRFGLFGEKSLPWHTPIKKVRQKK